jgi:hypothetical protein
MPDTLLIGLVALTAVAGFVAVKYLLLWRIVRAEPGGESESGPGPAGMSVLLVFTFLWTAFVGTADVIMGCNAVRQARTLGFAAAEGEVRSCSVAVVSDDEGTSYDVRVEYAYEVGEETFTSTRVRYDPLWGCASAARFKADHPPGSPVMVYYDPEDPDEAVLQRGLDGGELFLTLFLLPFHLIMVGSWSALARRGRTGPPYPLDSLITGGNEQRVRMPPNTPTAAASGVLFAGGFAGAMLVAFFVGMPPSVPLMVCVWVVVLGAAAVAYRWAVVRGRSGRYDLVVDRGRRKVILPATFGRKEPVAIPLADLREVRVVEEERKDSDGDKKRVFVPTVVWRARGEAPEGKLAEWEDRARAQRLAEWLRRATGLAVTAS